MECQIKVSKEAQKDLVTARYFYKGMGAIDRFDQDLLQQLSYLKRNPYFFQIKYKSIRCVHFKSFRYSIHYLINEQNVEILRILNHSQEYK